MTQSREERVREWTITTWYFLHNGTMPEDEDIENNADEALRWGESNIDVSQRFASIHARHSIIQLARTHTPEALAASKVADLWNIQTSEDKAFINQVLAQNEEYGKLKKKAENWENNPSYEAIGCLYFVLWPLAIFLRIQKSRSQEASLQAEHIAYVVADTYFRSLDADEDYRRQLQILMNDYWASNGE